MAVKTMSATSGSGQYNAGWHELTISKAEYGSWKGPKGTKRYIDVWFEGYSENMNMRVYETTTKEGEEFKIANLFKMANAGILHVLQDPTGKRPVIQYDDEATNLVGKTVNTFFYKETKTGNEYSRIFDSVAPVAQEGEHLSFTVDQVAGIKKSVETNYNKRAVSQTNSNGFAESTVSETTDTVYEDIPF